MASVAQIQANRSNALKSTGPRTAAGKERASQNAIKHGLLARDSWAGRPRYDVPPFHAACGYAGRGRITRNEANSRRASGVKCQALGRGGGMRPL